MQRPAFLRSLPALAATAICLGGCSEREMMASLRTGFEHGTYLFEVERHEANGYPLRIMCIERCPHPVDHVEPLGDHPLGLFADDQDELIFYLTASGSAYQVRVWQLTGEGVRRVAELASGARPDFMRDARGEAVIRTYEGESNLGPLRTVYWSYRDGVFARSDPR